MKINKIVLIGILFLTVFVGYKIIEEDNFDYSISSVLGNTSWPSNYGFRDFKYLRDNNTVVLSESVHSETKAKREIAFSHTNNTNTEIIKTYSVEITKGSEFAASVKAKLKFFEAAASYSYQEVKKTTEKTEIVIKPGFEVKVYVGTFLVRTDKFLIYTIEQVNRNLSWHDYGNSYISLRPEIYTYNGSFEEVYLFETN